MFKKSRAIALAVATAGAVGFGAPMASAATTSIGLGDNGGLNVSQDLALPMQYGQGNGAWLGGSDPMAGFWGGDNGGWGNGGWHHKRHKHHKQVQEIQICNNIVIINVINGQKKGHVPSDPGHMSGKNTFIQKNNCQQYND